MTFKQFALRNVMRNKRIYAAYFLSSMFTVMVFFTFANFAFHPALRGDHLQSEVTFGMLVAGGIIYVFSFFYILYSMSSFLQSRKKEFGVLMIHGMSNRQIRWMVFLENMFIGFFATVFGISLGLLFSKAILLIAENVLVLDSDLNFYFPIIATITTFISFTALFVFISIFVTFMLRTKRLVTFIKGRQIGKSEPKASVLLTIFAILLLGSGYVIALKAEGSQVVIALIPVVLLVITGTYFLFTQLSVFVIYRLKAQKRLFWKKTNMLLFSDLSFRMKDNARSFFIVAVISTVAFSAIGTLVGLNSFLTDGLQTANPTAFNYALSEDDREIEEIDQILADYHLTTEKAEIDLTLFDQDGQKVFITTADHYNAFADLIGEQKIELGDEQVTVVEQSDANMMASPKNLDNTSVILADGTKAQVDKDVVGIAKPNILPVVNHYYIVGKKIYEQLPEPISAYKQVAWEVIDGKEDDIIDVGRKLSEKYPGFTAIDYIIYDIHKVWSPVMLVGLFIGIVFFVSAGSFLYFRLYTDLEDDKEKFIQIRKIGLTTKELKKVIGRQITILFFSPIIVALIHGAVALTALSNMFGYNLICESTIVLGSFFMIQVLYYLVVRFFYTRQIKRAIY